MHLFKLTKVFVQIAKCIYSNYKMYLLKLQDVFVQIVKCICHPFVNALPTLPYLETLNQCGINVESMWNQSGINVESMSTSALHHTS